MSGAGLKIDGKPTEGPWTRRGLSIDAPGEKTFIICSPTKIEGKCFANAALIAEAGTVYHETGMTPRQLADHLDVNQESQKLIAAERDRLKQENAELVELLNPILQMHEKLTAGKYNTAERIEKGEQYDCPLCDGNGCVEGAQYINFGDKPLNVLFSGIDDEFINWQKFFDAFMEQLPKIKAALTQHTGKEG